MARLGPSYQCECTTAEFAEKLFNCAELAQQEDGWTLSYESVCGRISTCPAPCKTGQLVRLNYTIECPTDANESFVRPEVIAASRTSDSLGDMGHTIVGLVRTVEPGHALVWRRISDRFKHTFLHHLRLLMGPAEEPHNNVGEALQLDDMHIARFAQRRDFPQPGMLSMFVAAEFEGPALSPPSLYTSKRSEQVTLLGLPFLEMTQLLYQPLETFSDWTRPHFDRMLLSGAKFVSTMTNSASMAALRHTDKDFYLIINLKRCMHGPPLLPAFSESSMHVSVDIGARNGLSHWVQHSPHNFKLSDYLQAFLERVGSSEVQIYGSLDGHVLVPYQAVVNRLEWMQIMPAVLTAFDIQQSAYRRLYKGKAAPELQFGKEPRFLPQRAPSTTTNQQQKPADTPMKVAVHNTFIQFPDDDSCTMPRRAVEAYW